MSEHQHPVIMCDGYDPDLGCPDMAVELDVTLGGLARISGVDGAAISQLPDGWTGPAPGTDRTGLKPHRCPRCTAKHLKNHEEET